MHFLSCFRTPYESQLRSSSPQTPTTIADRERCETSAALPDQLVSQAKQQRRTKAQIVPGDKKIALDSAAKSKTTQKRVKRGVKTVAAVGEDLRIQDEYALVTTARPDLVAAELERAAHACAAVKNPQPPMRPQGQKIVVLH
ncbi:hypothetical protein K438DRAFT_1754762 [Mycena galopus ATCC 62051]|nr:hypothetical protein K438DRAFT_1754762 [Mycena galopus ATCC 62051]